MKKLLFIPVLLFVGIRSIGLIFKDILSGIDEAIKKVNEELTI